MEMNMCKAQNKRNVRVMTCNEVYIGRPSKWGNPFVIGKDGNRDEVIAKYENYLVKNKYLMSQLHELKGKNLVCWCAPLACHADVLIKLANN